MNNLYYRIRRHFEEQLQLNSVVSDVIPGLITKTMARNVKQSLKKVKCTLVQALRLCKGRTAHRGSRGIAVLYRH